LQGFRDLKVFQLAYKLASEFFFMKARRSRKMNAFLWLIRYADLRAV